MTQHFDNPGASFRQLMALATVKVRRPDTDEDEWCLPLHLGYGGNAFRLNSGGVYYARYRMLADSLVSRRYDTARLVTMPNHSDSMADYVPSARELFEELCKSKEYAYRRNEMKAIEKYKDRIVDTTDDAIILEDCIGKGDQTIKILEYMHDAKKAPRLIIVNDMVQDNVREAVQRIKVATRRMRTKDGQRIAVIGAPGDCLDPETYKGKDIAKQMIAAGISPSYNGDLLAYVRDYKKVGVFKFGNTAPDFDQSIMLPFYRDNFPVGTIYYMAYDWSTNKTNLDRTYGGQPFGADFLRAGFSDACWKAAAGAPPLFNPCDIGIRIFSIDWGKPVGEHAARVNVRHEFFELENPKNIIPLTPILKWESPLQGVMLAEHGMKLLQTMPCPSDEVFVQREDPNDRTISGLVMFCHREYLDTALTTIVAKLQPPAPSG